MTENQKAEIASYRAEGLGYKRISQVMGISENTIKTYCRRHRMGSAEAATSHDTCKRCGATIHQTTGGRARVFCSDECRYKYWKAHIDQAKSKALYSFVCPNCGKPFTAYGAAGRKYCSHACYIAARFGGPR